MNRFTGIIFFALALALGSALHAEPLNTNYVVSNRDAVGVIRAFDDGSNTILQFVDLDHDRPQLTDQFGKHLSYRRVGEYAVLPGIKTDVHIASDGHEAEVRAAAATPIAWPVPGAEGPAPAGLSSPSGFASSQKTSTAHAWSGGNGKEAAPQTWPTALHPMPATPATLAAINEPLPSRVGVRTHTVAAAASSTPPKELPLPAPSPSPVPKVVKSEPIWQADAGSDAKTMLIAWARAAHWTVQWDPPFTYPIESRLSYRGDFVSVVEQHFKHYTDRRETDQPICIDMHRGNSTIHVYLPDDSNQCSEVARNNP
jgi:hypothetical protein